MILLIRVRAENSVALNFPRRQPGQRRPCDDARGCDFLSWILRLDKAFLVSVSAFTIVHNTSCTVSAPGCYSTNLMAHVGRYRSTDMANTISMMDFFFTYFFFSGSENMTIHPG